MRYFRAHKPLRKMCNRVVQRYKIHFKVLQEPNLWYTPQVVCQYCRRSLKGRKVKGVLKVKIKFCSPAFWLSCGNHVDEKCYFCATKVNTACYKYSTRDRISYYKSKYVVAPKLKSECRSSDCKVCAKDKFILKKSYCSNQCFLCLWKWLAKDKHYTAHVWAKKTREF